MTIIKSNEITIAVLPFQILSNNNDFDYLVEGFGDDLIIDLSRFNLLHVISPNSTKIINHDGGDELDLIQKLHTDYIVKGSFRFIKESLRINIQLVNTKLGSIVWANRYNEKLSAIFDIHDEIIQKIVSSLQEQIHTNILAVSRQKQISNLKAYECWLRGVEHLQHGTHEADDEARKYFNQALNIEPNYARAYTGISLSYFNEWSCQSWDRWDASQQGAFKYARKAIALDETDTVSLTVLGRIFVYKGDYEKGEHFLRKSLRLNPNDASNLLHIAVSFVYLGYTKEAEQLYLKAMKLNPLNEESYFASGSLIYLELGEYEKAIELGLKTNFDHVWVDMPAILAAAYYHIKNTEKMWYYWKIYQENFKERILHGKSPSPNEEISWIIDISPYKVKSNQIPLLEYIKNEVGSPNIVKEQLNENSHKNIFRKGSGLWEMSFEGKSVFLPDAKGYHDIKALLENNNKEIHCTELMGNNIQFMDEEYVFDAKAKEEYKKKIQELSLDIDEAELMNDIHKAELLRNEYEELVDHLSKSLGLGGNIRALKSPIDRTRSAVTWRIRNAIKKMDNVHPSLGKHLSNSIKTGIFCSYSPEKNLGWYF